MFIPRKTATATLLVISISLTSFCTTTLALGLEKSVAENINQAHFDFTKQGTLFSRPSNMPQPGPYYTSLVKMSEVRDFPYDYALYFSTDHDDGAGGIWMYVCNGSPSSATSWKSYDQAVIDGDFDYLQQKPAKNPIFVDTIQGSQTETPHANVIDGTVFMTYHNLGAGRNQSTLLATSPDGVNFSRINGDDDSVILDYTGEPGDGHTGYFRWGPNPFSGIPHRYVGYSLHGGGYDYFSALWGSDNAVDWQKLAVLSPIEQFAEEGEHLLIWHELDPNSIVSMGNGEYIAICAGGNRAYGSMARVVELYEIFLADDGRKLTRKARKIVARGASGADDAEEAAEPTTVVIGSTWHMIYVGTKEQGSSNAVMAASGRLVTSAAKNQTTAPISLLLQKE